MSRWFRHYAGLCRDEKLVRVALKTEQSIERIVWVYSALLESAAELNQNGRYDVDLFELAYFLRVDPDKIQAIMDALEESNRVKDNVLLTWTKRQYKSDTSADRVRRHREKKASETAPSNGDVTVTAVTEEKCNAVKRTIDTDTETESDIESTAPPAAAKDSVHELDKKYAIHAGDIRITYEHFEELKRDNPYIPNMKAFIQRRLGALQAIKREGKRNWFQSLKGFASAENDRLAIEYEKERIHAEAKGKNQQPPGRKVFF